MRRIRSWLHAPLGLTLCVMFMALPIEPTTVYAQIDTALVRRMLDSASAVNSSTRAALDTLRRYFGGGLPVTRSLRDSLLFTGLRATDATVRGVLSGGSVMLQLSRPLPLDRTPTVHVTSLFLDRQRRRVDTTLEITEIRDDGLIVEVPGELPAGHYQIEVAVPGIGADSAGSLVRPRKLEIVESWWIGIAALIPLIVVTLFIVMLCVKKYKTPQGQYQYSIWTLLFLEPANNTYSLSRAQFIAWTAVISAGYVFLFLARGVVENTWAFPPLGGFAITFLISLGTLIGAQATSNVRGAKGSGDIHPSAADFVVHGGVLALERVQQVLWTFISIGMFIWIILGNYTSATALPTIPEELLYLMGISSGGYLIGKMVRKPGPIVNKIDAMVAAGAVYLKIEGDHLSKDAFIWVDGAQLQDRPTVVTADIDAPNEFASVLQVKLPAVFTTAGQWYSRSHSVTVVNADGQRSQWDSMPVITNVIVGAAANGAEPLTIEGQYIGSEMAWGITGAAFAPPATKPTRNDADPTRWIVSIIREAGSPQPFRMITVTDNGNPAQPKTASFKWQPPATPAQAPPAAPEPPAPPPPVPAPAPPPGNASDAANAGGNPDGDDAGNANGGGDGDNGS